ncbi:hypothetical protein A3A46_01230 [Candidatus Roizmanbacteria bacterium RIFCSPLOWO2_01_FULL_37_13]|uniref:TNase-like domain-containing protein n=1 Tax=Candidatus Roizmanbacteria bacterium RIFCSPHIGHO2_02_FULL_38_11 TaxID=1802039 RepID=A0A1F7GVP4_9BACT|nr:MAG: hypothetical protein A3C25_03785 [Candidatus Roizmanbacteria bacterium RIFCSPHIGHO2_02_FULL_38_11]OGK41563.1 MAG: hypothetical protein A3A46_01230 [Candidatus Roizmanbacteria bacterium RIFCSPLOWO2_01_FULL_37_13]
MRSYRPPKKTLTLIIALLILLANSINQLIKSPAKRNISQSLTPTITTATPSAELAKPGAELNLVKVVKVIDGDTIIIESGQKVRYIGIDTPELHHPKKKLECFGKEARDKNKELVEGKLVRLEKDVSETDRYWRLLRFVYVPTESSPSGLFVNDYLVRDGFAYSSTFPPDVKYSDHFKNLENQARENNRGLWNKCN